MSAETKNRYVKCVKATYSEIKDDKFTAKINRIVHTISEHGGKIVSFSQPTVAGVGMSTVYYFVMVIYEAHEEIPSEYFKEKTAK